MRAGLVFLLTVVLSACGASRNEKEAIDVVASNLSGMTLDAATTCLWSLEAFGVDNEYLDSKQNYKNNEFAKEVWFKVMARASERERRPNHSDFLKQSTDLKVFMHKLCVSRLSKAVKQAESQGFSGLSARVPI